MTQLGPSRPAAELPQSLRDLARPMTCAKGTWIFRQGEPVRAVFMLIEGEVRLLRYSSQGSEVALQRVRPGDFFAEAAVGASRYRCNAIASRPVRLRAFPIESVRALLASDPVFGQQWVALLARGLHGARARLERLALRSAADRVLHYLHTEGHGSTCEVVLAGTVKDLARELGLSHENLYRTLARLERGGRVGREGDRLFLR